MSKDLNKKKPEPYKPLSDEDRYRSAAFASQFVVALYYVAVTYLTLSSFRDEAHPAEVAAMFFLTPVAAGILFFVIHIIWIIVEAFLPKSVRAFMFTSKRRTIHIANVVCQLSWYSVLGLLCIATRSRNYYWEKHYDFWNGNLTEDFWEGFGFLSVVVVCSKQD